MGKGEIRAQKNLHSNPLSRLTFPLDDRVGSVLGWKQQASIH
jgi:hypothetical protein